MKEKNKRKIISLDQISFFTDSVNSFYIDYSEVFKFTIQKGETFIEKCFYSYEEANQCLSKLAEKIILDRDVVFFADKYFVSDKVSLIDFGEEEGNKNRVVRIFFKNGDFVDVEIPEDEKTEEVLQDFFDDLKLGKTFRTEKYLFILEKITGFEVGEYDDKPALLIGVEGPYVVPIFNRIDYYLKELYNLINLEPSGIYS